VAADPAAAVLAGSAVPITAWVEVLVAAAPLATETRRAPADDAVVAEVETVVLLQPAPQPRL
jgi:hypothetical protein